MTEHLGDGAHIDECTGRKLPQHKPLPPPALLSGNVLTQADPRRDADASVDLDNARTTWVSALTDVLRHGHGPSAPAARRLWPMLHRNSVLVALVVTVAALGVVATWHGSDGRWPATAVFVCLVLLSLFHWPPRVRR